MAKRSSVKIVLNDVIDPVQRGVTQSLLKAGIAIVANARPLAPVDTARLRNSITYAVRGKSWQNEVGNFGVVQGKTETIRPTEEDRVPIPDTEQTAFVGTNVNYAAAVEFGHLVGGKTPSFRLGQPFLTPAIESVKDRITKIAGVTINAELQDVR